MRRSLLPVVLLLTLATPSFTGTAAAQGSWQRIIEQGSPAAADLNRTYTGWIRRQSPCELVLTPVISDSVTLVSPADADVEMYVVAGDPGGQVSPYAPVAPPSDADTLAFALVEQRCSSMYKSPSWLLLERDGRQLLYITEEYRYPYLRVAGHDGRLVGLEWDHERGQVQPIGSKARREAAHRDARVREMRAKGWRQRAIDAVLAERIYIGMNQEMVRAAWGAPDDINRTILPASVHEQWVYGLGSYVYFENGIVTAIQN